MQWSAISFHAPSRTLRQFAGLCLLVFGGLAIWHAYLGNTGAAIVFTLIAAAIGPLGLVFPRAIRHVYGGAMMAAFPIGWAVSKVLLAMLFFGLVTPIAVLFRLIGRDVLQRRRRDDQSTYWVGKPAAPDAKSYFRQF